MIRIRKLNARALNCDLKEAFDIAGGGLQRAENVLVCAELTDGTRGYGEGAPFPDFNGETQNGTFAAVRQAAPALIGRPITEIGAAARDLGRMIPKNGAARAGIETALLDAWSRSHRFPLRLFFGGAQTRIVTDVTIPIVSPEHAHRSALAWKKFGITALKIKVGRDPEKDFERIRAAKDGHPKARLLLDANAGYDADTALKLLSRLKRAKIVPALFEQPAGARDLKAMARIAARGGVPVAADESVTCGRDVLDIARTGAAGYVNIKIMKSGVFESLEIARTARAAGLGLMIGGLVESPLAMTCSAHLAAGLGGFSFVDLDTPLFFTREPMRGVKILRGGVYDLSKVRAGLGVAPKFVIMN